ncbi:hypothetical protein BKP64_06345 [Marinobacter salinus]|uniref:Uncharacterized protein n=1 Tax=Marinobacter salinus TaxID=1874317 RepID=A0A1D9GJM3_9GAMM|nr:hypothetical protein BKP64_06345 [Marinobacter salinus]
MDDVASGLAGILGGTAGFLSLALNWLVHWRSGPRVKIRVRQFVYVDPLSNDARFGRSTPQKPKTGDITTFCRFEIANVGRSTTTILAVDMLESVQRDWRRFGKAIGLTRVPHHAFISGDTRAVPVTLHGGETWACFIPMAQLGEKETKSFRVLCSHQERPIRNKVKRRMGGVLSGNNMKLLFHLPVNQTGAQNNMGRDSS